MALLKNNLQITHTIRVYYVFRFLINDVEVR